MEPIDNKILYNLPEIVRSSRSYFGPYYKIKSDDNIIINNDICMICLDKFKVGLYKRNLSCNHNFHKKCIDKWFRTNNQRCPICRETHII